MLLSSRLGIYAAAWGAVLGAAAHLGIRVVGALRAGFPIRPRLEVRTAPVAEFIRLMIPKMVSHPIEPLTFLYFTALATTFAAGDVTAVSFARNFQSLPVSLIGIAFSIAAFPALSIAAAEGDRARFVSLVRVNAITIAVLATAAAIGLIVVGGFAIRLFLGGGEFGEDDVARTTLLLSAFAIAIPFESLVYLFSRAVYATRNTLLAVLASVAGFVVTIVTGELLAPAHRRARDPGLVRDRQRGEGRPADPRHGAPRAHGGPGRGPCGQRGVVGTTAMKRPSRPG